jgi:hypothetical protein
MESCFLGLIKKILVLIRKEKMGNNNRHKPRIILPNQPPDPIYKGIYDIIMAYITMTGDRIKKPDQLIGAIAQSFRQSLDMNVKNIVNNAVRNAVTQYDTGIKEAMNVFFEKKKKQIANERIRMQVENPGKEVSLHMDEKNLDLLKVYLYEHLANTRIEINAEKTPKEQAETFKETKEGGG